jgi:excisionase family DNA binding protein
MGGWHGEGIQQMRSEALHRGAIKMPQVTSELMTRKQVAQLFQVSPLTIIRLEQAGKLPAVRLGAGSIRYRHADVLNFIAKSIVTA